MSELEAEVIRATLDPFEGPIDAIIDPEQRAPGQLTPPGDTTALRARARYIEASTHPLWVTWLRDSKEDMGFYVGGKGQWSYGGSFDDWDTMEREIRPHLSINHCQSVIDIMSGYQIQNRVDIKASPQGKEDDELAELVTALLRWEQEQCFVQRTISEMFEDGNIIGMDVAEVGIREDPVSVSGKPDVKRLAVGREILWDPHWTAYDLSDARYVLTYKWAYIEDVIAQWPEYEEEIRRAARQLGDAFAAATQVIQGIPGDNYGSVRGHPVENPTAEGQFFDPVDQRVLVLEMWDKVQVPRHLVADVATGRVTRYDTRLEALDVVKGDPTHLRYDRRTTDKVRMATILPALYLTLEEDRVQYPNDDEAYPFVPYIAKRKGDTVYGVMRNLKDPQRVENKRWSQILFLLTRFVNMRPLVPKGSLDTPDQVSLSDASTTAPLYYNPDKGKPEWFAPPIGEMVRVLQIIAGEMKLAEREVSGVNTEALGLQSDVSSGVAIGRRQQQAQIITTRYFDNLSRTTQLVGQRLARRSMQTRTGEQIYRLTNRLGGSAFVRLNPIEARSMTEEQFREWQREVIAQGQPAVLRTQDILKYDIVINESPSTPSARATGLMALLTIVEKMQMLLPAFIEEIMELIEIPNKDKVLQRVRAMLAQAMPQPGGGAPGPQPGGMPGAEPVPAAPAMPALPPQPVSA